MPSLSSSRPRSFLQAAFWMVLIALISVSNDVIAKFLGSNLHPFQISFLRFAASLAVLLPVLFAKIATDGPRVLKTQMPALHFWRGFWGTAAVALCTCSVLKFQIACNTSIMFAQPLLFLPLAAIFLKERITPQRLFCTLLGLLGIFVVLFKEVLAFNTWLFVPLASAFLFAVISVIAKKMTQTEPILTSLFSFALTTTVLSFIPALMTWQPVTAFQLALVGLLGLNANLMQVCLFKAYALSEAASLAPLQYLEFVFSVGAGYLFFHQIPSWNVFGGCALIILAALLVGFAERARRPESNC